MACPCFYPVEPLAETRWPPPHLPLGELYAGECRSAGEPHLPAGECLRTYCNLGYGRGRCERFPGGPDAARFLIVGYDERSITVSYVLEREHLPYGHGRLEFQTASGSFRPDGQGAILERQALAYVEAYLRRKASWKFRTARTLSSEAERK